MKKVLLLIALFPPFLFAPKNSFQFCSVPSQLARKIATNEGFFKRGTLPFRLHNPGALIYAGQKFAKKGKNKFAQFIADSFGWDALERDIQLKRQRKASFKIAWDYLP